jgi:glutaminase
MPPTPGPRHLQATLDEIAAELAEYPDRGEVSHAIPQLTRIDPQKFAAAIALIDGPVISTGAATEPFSIQSISKVLTLTLALGRFGDRLWQRVGREPSGSPFNSIVQLEYEKGIPRNPFINAGALVVTDAILAGHEPREVIGEILRFARFLAEDESILIDPEVARSEQATGFRNAALANYIKAFGNLIHPAEHVLGVYFHQCAIAMSCQQLARAGLYLANGGCVPSTGHNVISSLRARRVNAVMLTCGLYDGSGDFAFRVGLPGKSGIGGGILAIVPNQAAIAVWSPGLNSQGNSKLGIIALERIAHRTGWNIFASESNRA